ncbi:MAG: hypothetical protein IMY70_05570, partial [Bacteroidetes bacterium]|nr:hypothetical protein [Bacteroidota bacterium]
DFDTTADWEDITVVYGIIDQNDSMQYIKINKAFLGEGNVLQFAQVYDSSNYTFDMKVWLEGFNENGQLVQTIEFDTATSYKPDDPEAVFPTGAQTIYKGGPETFYEIKWIIEPPWDTVGFRKLWLNDENTYKLNIMYPDSSKLVTSETQLVQDFSITRPVPGQTTIKFVTNPAVPYVFEWEKAPNDEGRFKYEFRLVFHYEELTFDNSLREKSIDLVSNVTVHQPLSGSEMYYYYWDNNFFSSCVNKIPYADPNEEDNIKERYTGDIEIIVSVAGEAFNLFMQVYEPSTSIVQEKPPYTNVENGIGVFSSRYRIFDDKILHDETKADLISIEELKFIR